MLSLLGKLPTSNRNGANSLRFDLNRSGTIQSAFSATSPLLRDSLTWNHAISVQNGSIRGFHQSCFHLGNPRMQRKNARLTVEQREELRRETGEKPGKYWNPEQKRFMIGSISLEGHERMIKDPFGTKMPRDKIHLKKVERMKKVHERSRLVRAKKESKHEYSVRQLKLTELLSNEIPLAVANVLPTTPLLKDLSRQTFNVDTVEVGRDLKHVTIYWSPMQTEHFSSLNKLLSTDKVVKAIRESLASNTSYLKYCPDLRFLPVQAHEVYKRKILRDQMDKMLKAKAGDDDQLREIYQELKERDEMESLQSAGVYDDPDDDPIKPKEKLKLERYQQKMKQDLIKKVEEDPSIAIEKQEREKRIQEKKIEQRDRKEGKEAQKRMKEMRKNINFEFDQESEADKDLFKVVSPQKTPKIEKAKREKKQHGHVPVKKLDIWAPEKMDEEEPVFFEPPKKSATLKEEKKTKKVTKPVETVKPKKTLKPTTTSNEETPKVKKTKKVKEDKEAKEVEEVEPKPKKEEKKPRAKKEKKVEDDKEQLEFKTKKTRKTKTKE